MILNYRKYIKGEIIPTNVIFLTTLSQNVLRQSPKNKIKKLLYIQGAVVNEIYRRKRILQRGTAVVSRETVKELYDLVKTTYVRLLLVTSRSQFSLCRFENRVDVEPLVRVVRWYLGGHSLSPTFTRMTDGTAMTKPHTRTVLLDHPSVRVTVTHGPCVTDHDQRP